MATIDDVTASIVELNDSIATIDLKLDEVKAKIDRLSAGSVVTQAQIDALNAALSSAKTEAAKVLSEASDLAG